MTTVEDRSIYRQIKEKGEQLAELVKMAEDIQNNNDKTTAEAYQAGLADAWETARALVWDTSISEYETAGVKVDDWDGETCEVLRRYPAHEAVELLRTIRERKDSRIEVGDEVRNKVNGLTYIVTLASECGYVLLGSDGNCATSCVTNSFEKTGKHYDIASILEAMRTHD